MRGDFSRIRRGRGTGYTSVLEQQGRVSLDADANEQRFLDEQLRRTETADVIGEFGGQGFAITVPETGNQILIGPGSYYIAGLRADNPSPVSYDSQLVSLPPGKDSAAALLGMLPGPPGEPVYLAVVLQVWQRLVTALDDSCLRDPALGQADTTVRLQTLWRVLARPVPADVNSLAGPFCPVLYGNQPAASTGTLSVSTGASGSACGCGPVATAGYQGVENQLYRVEIHTPGDLSSAAFKWSRENGSVVSAVASVALGSGASGSTVQVSSPWPDLNLGFQAGQWVELTDDTREFADPPGAPGILYQVQATDKDTLTMTLAGPVSAGSSRNARVRRWDQAGPAAGPAGVPLAAGTPVPGGGMQFELENGILVTFGPGTYRAGDYWTFPARTATGTVEWPPCDSDGNAAQPPYSTEVHEAPLACVYVPWEGPATSAGRERGHGPGRPPVTPGPSSGTAQGPVLPEEAVPPAATVLQQAGGAEKTSVNLAGLLAHGGHGIVVRGGQSGAASTQEPVIEDCRRPFRPLAITQPIHVQSINWPNDDLLPIDVLAANGLMVTLDQAVSGPVDSGRFIVTLEAFTSPYLSEAGVAQLRTSYVLDSPIVVSGQQLTWQLGQPALGYVQELISSAEKFRLYVRVRVRLPGQAYFAAYGTELIYLDGRAFGQPGTRTDGTTPRVDLRFPSGDGSAASDLESWFYLAPALTATALTPTSRNAFTTVADSGGNFIGVVPAGSTGATPVTEAGLTATLSYAAVVNSTLSVTISSSSSSNPLLANIVSAPATVAIAPAQSSVTIPLTFSGNMPAGTPLNTITIDATVVSANEQIPNAPPATTTVTLSAPGGTTPAPAAAGGSPPPAPTGAALVPDPPAPPTMPISPPDLPQPESPAQAEPPAQPQPPQAPESSDPPASPPAGS
jgi:Family of unknown function (DUF6519)